MLSPHCAARCTTSSPGVTRVDSRCRWLVDKSWQITFFLPDHFVSPSYVPTLITIPSATATSPSINSPSCTRRWTHAHFKHQFSLLNTSCHLCGHLPSDDISFHKNLSLLWKPLLRHIHYLQCKLPIYYHIYLFFQTLLSQLFFYIFLLYYHLSFNCNLFFLPKQLFHQLYRKAKHVGYLLQPFHITYTYIFLHHIIPITSWSLSTFDHSSL